MARCCIAAPKPTACIEMAIFHVLTGLVLLVVSRHEGAVHGVRRFGQHVRTWRVDRDGVIFVVVCVR